MTEALPRLCALPEGCIVGEPTEMRAVRARKGKAAAQVRSTPERRSRT